MPDADIVERLTEVRGIGPWTVEMLLDISHGAARRAASNGLRRAQGIRADLSAAAKESRAIEASDLPKPDAVFKRGQKWATVSLGGELVLVARLRSGKSRSGGRAIGRERL